MVSVRDADREDADAVMAAHVAAIEARGPAAYDERQVAAWAERPDGAAPYRELARDDDHVFVVAEREGAAEAGDGAGDGTAEGTAGGDGRAVVGFGHLVPPAARDEAGEQAAGEEPAEDDDGLGPAEGEVRAVYVHGDHAGQGVGTALLAHLESAARERGLAALELTASLNAVGFYEHHGYERVERTVHETTGGVALPVVVMRTRLAARAGREWTAEPE